MPEPSDLKLPQIFVGEPVDDGDVTLDPALPIPPGLSAEETAKGFADPPPLPDIDSDYDD